MFHVEQSSNNNLFLTCRDHTVSGELFDVIRDPKNDLLKTSVTFDQNHLQKYYKSDSYISHSNRKESIFEKVYFLSREVAQHFKWRLILKYKLAPKTLLDVGAGVGHFVRSAQRRNWQAKGIEVSAKARSIANSKSPNSVFPTSHLKNVPDNSQTIITLWHVLEHIPNLHEQAQELKRLLHHKGRLIVAVPNYKSFDAKYFGSFWAAYDVPRHLWHFSRQSMIKFFEEHDMAVESIHPMWLDSFYVSLLSTKNKCGKMRIIKGLWIGLLSNLKAIRTKEFSSLIFVIKHKKS